MGQTLRLLAVMKVGTPNTYIIYMCGHFWCIAMACHRLIFSQNGAMGSRRILNASQVPTITKYGLLPKSQNIKANKLCISECIALY